MATTYTDILANSSLISYSGNWSTGTYQPLSDGATASIHYLGGGVSWMGVGELGSNSIDGGITTRIDASSSAGHNYTILGSSNDNPYRAVQDVPLPFGRHTADFVFDGVARNFTFTGFKLSTNFTDPSGPDTSSTLTAGDVVPTDQIQFYGETQTAPGKKTFWADNTTITSVEGANTGFAFNFSAVGLTVYGSPNATADVDYSVYFNTTGEPSSIDPNTIPFDKYTQKQGTGGVIFYVGAMPAGNHRILFVNNGDTPLGLQGAIVHWPGNYTTGLTACYVNCTDAEKQQLAGTDFQASGASGGAMFGLSWSVLLASCLSGLSAALLL